MKKFLILNSKSPKNKRQILSEQGFTLVEMLAVIIVFIVIGSIMVSILVTSLRTSHKTDVLTQVRENGNYVMTQVSKSIRDARGLISPFPCVTSTTVSTITILTADQDEITYTCTS
ncbi:MAG TPA: type II secretion system protein, partial [Patescibacteria group bacterium]